MKVKIDYLFSKNEKIGSKFIQWGTKHLSNRDNVPSHVAILVNGRWVHESTLTTGVRVISYSKWKEMNEEVAAVSCDQKLKDYNELKALYRSIRDKNYDWPGVTYCGYRIFLNKYFGSKMPEVNIWEDEDKYFCCEAVAKLTGMGNFSMKAPVELLDELSNN